MAKGKELSSGEYRKRCDIDGCNILATRTVNNLKSGKQSMLCPVHYRRWIVNASTMLDEI
jgi:hypothetical protein